jgi:hypothetical protein
MIDDLEIMDELPVERWRAIGSLPYEVSDRGRVRRTRDSLTDNGGVRSRAGRILRDRPAGHGYRTVALEGMGDVYVHRLVACAFIPNPHALPQVNHKNRIRHENGAGNLEWTTCAGNIRHAAACGSYNGLNHARGEKSGTAKLTENDVRQMRALSSAGNTHRTIAAAFGVAYVTAARVVTRKAWEHVQ